MSYALWEGLAVANVSRPLLAAAGAGIDASPAAGIAPRTQAAHPIAGSPAARRPFPPRTHQDLRRPMTNHEVSATMPRVVDRPAGGARSGSMAAHRASRAASAREAADGINGGVEQPTTPDSGAPPAAQAGPGAASG